MSFQEQFNQRVAARQARYDRRLADNAFTNNAQMAVNRLWELGPQGQEWANRIASDPHAGMAMLEQYGGVDAIDRRLRLGQAIENSEAYAGMDPVARHFLELGGPQMLERMANANQLNAQAYERRADADQTRAHTNVIRGVLGGEGGAGGAVPANAGALERLGLASAISGGDYDDITDARERLHFGAPRSEIVNHFEKRKKEYVNAPLLDTTRRELEMWDPTNNLDIISMVHRFQKMIDEGIVRKEDVDKISMATSSGFESLRAHVEGYLFKSKQFPKEMGTDLLNAIAAATNIREEAMLAIYQDDLARAEAGGWTDEGLAFGMPYRQTLQRMQERANVNRGLTPDGGLPFTDEQWDAMAERLGPDATEDEILDALEAMNDAPPERNAPNPAAAPLGRGQDFLRGVTVR